MQIRNLTAEPELRILGNGTAVANFTVASTPRTFDRQSGERRAVIELEADEVGTSLRFTTAKPATADREPAATAPDGDEPPF